MTWTRTPIVGYTYTYDNANRLTSADFGYFPLYYNRWDTSGSYDVRNIEYTGNGNITLVKSLGYKIKLMDDLTYHYQTGTNRLTYITDAIVPITDYNCDVENQESNNYQYDDNGNMTQDPMSDIGFIIYDINNQPVAVYEKSDSTCFRYYYDTQGNRVRKDASIVEYYLNGVDGRTEVVLKSDSKQATYNRWANGLIGQIRRDGETWARYYYLKDHLGNIKVTLDQSAKIKAYTDFMPFGSVMESRSYNIGMSDTRYKFTGKERDVETGLDYFGARLYDSKIWRWLTIDPITSKNPNLSGYIYTTNNPIIFIDPMGLDTFNIILGNRKINRITVPNSTMHYYYIWDEGKIENNYSLEVLKTGLVKFPDSGPGFERYGPIDKEGDHYLRPEVAAALFGLTAEFAHDNSNFLISYGDMSTSQGKSPGGTAHKMHGGVSGYSGRCIDFRYLDKTGRSFQGESIRPRFNYFENFIFFATAGEWGFSKNYGSGQDVWGPVKGALNVIERSDHNDHGHLTYTR